MSVGETIRFRGRVDRVESELALGRKTFQILERLSGGARERYRAFDRLAGPHGDYRAIHVLRRSPETEQQLAVLQRLADLRNANVPFLVEYHVRGDKIYLVLAWTWGRSLADHWEQVRSGRETRFSAFHGCRLIRGLAHGLCQLHHRWNVNHGDLKPANLILSPGGRGLSTIDFGSAWLVERASQRTAGDGVSGVYTAPEILEQGAVPDFRSDQFSVSVVWYELLTGQIPYDAAGGNAGLAATRQAFENKFVPPSRIAAKMGDASPAAWRLIDEALGRGLALDRDGRYPSRREWLDALDEIHAMFRSRRGLFGWNRFVADWLTKFSAGRRPAS
jgi:serine/threonine protein kinase